MTARAVHRDAEGFWTDSGVGRTINELAGRVGSLVVAAAMAPKRRPLHDTQLAIDAESFIPLPELPSVAQGFGRARPARRQIRLVEDRVDVVVVQLPFAATLALVAPTRPRVYHLCADIEAIVRTSPTYQGTSGIPAKALARLIKEFQRQLATAKDARIVTNGRDLLEQHGEAQGRAVVSSTYRASEVLSVPRLRPRDAPFRMLFVGHLRPEKGTDILLAAYRRLLEDVPAAELAIVGADAAVDRGTSSRLTDGLDDRRARGRVLFLGPKPFGAELFQCFADADVLVLPSLSEGTPRVLLEARAFGCPVIASAVGGIKTSVRDGVDGLLVPPGDARAFGAAAARLAADTELRASLVTNGLLTARRWTLESFVDEIVAEIHLLVEGSSRARAA